MSSAMENNAKWALSKLKNPSRWWHLCASVQFGVVAICTKMVIELFNRTTVHNKEFLIKALDSRPKDTPLITVANHFSCIDDPGMWGVLRINQLWNKKIMRWGLAAHDFCFTEKSHSRFFLYGKGIPVIRGAGVYQPAIDMCIEKLKAGDWVHIFPEGKVNETKEFIRLKWGVGRMIYELPIIPIIIPIWHLGMDDLLPNNQYKLKPGKKITFNFGQPIDLRETIDHVKRANLDDEQARKYITDKIQAEMLVLRNQTEELHQQ